MRSGKSISEHLNQNLYDISYFYISKKGEWSLCKDFPYNINKINVKERFSKNVFEKLKNCDVAFPMLHGPFGEDGTIQGFFEMLSMPYVGCDHKSSAVAMDKAMTKYLCLANGINTSPFFTINKGQFKNNSQEFINKVNHFLKYPLYVKPVHLGSAIGVKKVNNPVELEDTILNIFKLDEKIIVEEEIVGREIEFAILGNSNVIVFPPGEVLTEGNMYTYDAKYSENGFKTSQKIDLEESKINEGKILAKKVFNLLDCQGLARIDFFLDKKGVFWLNEVNPLPGFTSISLYPSICNSNGLSYSNLLNTLIFLALHKHRKKMRMNLSLSKNAKII